VNQTKLESLLEASVNTAIGFFVALWTWQFIVAPLMGYIVTMRDNLVITGIFTVVSVARGYVLRRFFNAGLHRAIHKLARAIHGRIYH